MSEGLNLASGQGFALVDVACVERIVDGHVIIGGASAFPRAPLNFADHNPGNPFLPGGPQLALAHRMLVEYFEHMKCGMYPLLTGMPRVMFREKIRPGKVLVAMRLHEERADFRILGHDSKELASLALEYRLIKEDPGEAFLPLDFSLDEDDICTEEPGDGATATFVYKGDEIIPLDDPRGIPQALIPSVLFQAAEYFIGDPHEMVVATVLRQIQFHSPAPLGTLNLQVVTDVGKNPRGRILAVASTGNRNVVTGVFGYKRCPR